MICPYCGEKMEKGIIHGDRYKLKWIADEKDKGPFLQMFIKGIELEKEGSGVEAYYCETDGIILIKI
ncbi:hypothetical protein E4100_05035 [Soehngenia longivitae]|jgi:hypothetical protein|uniref:DUF6487 domain-containing protein n=1 Tax=Soehngenia longivitae TaxID=2562294 RepID=A0A4Z0D6C5_9FIRM|nr:PF20097 family protein [Soehngenia longivitae]MBC7087936.1 hypothetical protein [Tissierellales bacterium]TFZ40431.1 hypothetical protein E4100_05035 [Soehngenia longivitae]